MQVAQGAADEGDERGVVFPLTDGSRSTTATGRMVFADAAHVIDPGLAATMRDESAWHTAYVQHARELVARQAAQPEAAVTVAAAGLASVHRGFTYADDGARLPLPEAVAQQPRTPLSTVTIDGAGQQDPRRLQVPYRGSLLEGDTLHRQLDDWLERGVVEPSFAAAIRAVMANPDWLDLSDQRFAVLGAGAEMGPLPALCGWRAEVFAVDIPRPALWERVLRTARAGNARVHVPCAGPAPRADDHAAVVAAAGVDVITALPALTSWLGEAPGPLTVGNYIYADGATHVRATVAVDALVAHLTATRDDLTVALLATPTDVYAVPEEVVAAARARYAQRSTGRRAVARLSGGRAFAPGYPDTISSGTTAELGIADCMVAQQGPNYALAKRIQRWRALVARAEGHRCSINVAPATGTRSVTKNRILAAAYAGAAHFDVEVFEPETSNMLMAAMLVHDLRAATSPADPAVTLEHPLALFWRGAAHGGLWRQPYAARSVLPLAALRGWRAMLG